MRRLSVLLTLAASCAAPALADDRHCKPRCPETGFHDIAAAARRWRHTGGQLLTTAARVRLQTGEPRRVRTRVRKFQEHHEFWRIRL